MTDRKDRVQVYEDDAGGFRWRRVAGNGEVIADSGEAYTVKGHAIEAAKRVNGENGEHYELEIEESEDR